MFNYYEIFVIIFLKQFFFIKDILHFSYKLFRKKIIKKKKTISLTIAIRRKIYFGINLTKEMKNLHTEDINERC